VLVQRVFVRLASPSELLVSPSQSRGNGCCEEEGRRQRVGGRRLSCSKGYTRPRSSSVRKASEAASSVPVRINQYGRRSNALASQFGSDVLVSARVCFDAQCRWRATRVSSSNCTTSACVPGFCAHPLRRRRSFRGHGAASTVVCWDPTGGAAGANRGRLLSAAAAAALGRIQMRSAESVVWLAE
jgi:hypothetical protein